MSRAAVAFWRISIIAATLSLWAVLALAAPVDAAEQAEEPSTYFVDTGCYRGKRYAYSTKANPRRC